MGGHFLVSGSVARSQYTTQPTGRCGSSCPEIRHAVSACGVVQIQFRVPLPLPRSVVSLPFTVFIYYGYNARAIELVDLISVALTYSKALFQIHYQVIGDVHLMMNILLLEYR